MDSLLEFAPVEDVISALELICEGDEVEVMASSIFGLDSTLSLINFGCIKETDSVIAIASHPELITWSISYIYSPRKLVTNIPDSNREADKNKWRGIRELLSGYQHTAPIHSSTEVDWGQHLEEPFDAAIMGFIDSNISSSEEVKGRFTLETGSEYEMFEGLLIKSADCLREDGILVILSKPGWILKAWSLIDSLGLQLEYGSYRLYTECSRHPNVFVWLRFVKRGEGIDLELHKKNILSLMRDNGIDRLFAHRNNLIFPYVELSYGNSESYVKMDQNLEYMQYFFSVETTNALAGLCEGYTACLVTPSVAQCAHKIGKNIVLFERDNRFREKGGLKFVKYDLNTGLTKLMQNKYMKRFDRVICDPPFDIKLDILADDIVELLKQGEGSTAYIVFPDKRRASLVNAMKAKGLVLSDEGDKLCIEYARPPKLVRIHGRNAIQLYKFTYMGNL